jgi:CheY-like chemotaxis protein
VKLLESGGFEVVATAGEGDALVAVVEREQPGLVIADVRMPPTHTDEGIRAALAIRGRWPAIAILVLSHAHRPVRHHLGTRRRRRVQRSLMVSALRDEVIDLGFEDASRVNPDLLEEPLDLQADDPVNAGPGEKAEEQHPGVMR